MTPLNPELIEEIVRRVTKKDKTRGLLMGDTLYSKAGGSRWSNA